MPYTSRILPPEEWPRLVGTDVESFMDGLGPSRSQVFVVEDGEQIVATVVGVPSIVMECCWIDPEHRHSPAVGRRLALGMKALTNGLGLARMITLPGDDAVERMAIKLGGTKVTKPAVVVPVGDA